MLGIIKTVLARGNARSALLLFLSSATSSALGYAFLTVLAKKMSVSDFGSLRLLVETSATLFPFLALGFQYTNTKVLIHAPESDQARIKAAALFVATLSAAVSTLFLGWISSILPKSIAGVYAAIGGLSYVVFMTMFKEIANAILPAQKAIRYQAVHLVLPQIVLVSAVLCIDKQVDLNFAASLIVTTNVLFSASLMCLSGVSFNRFRESIETLIKQNRRVGLPIYLSSYVSMGGLLVFQLVTGSQLTSAEYANLSMSVVLSGIVTLVSSSVIMVKISEFARDSRISLNVIKGALVSMIGAALCTMSVAWVLTQFVLGDSFANVIDYLPFLILCSLSDGVSFIYNRFFLAKNFVSTLSKISISNGVLIFVLSLSLIPFLGVVGVIATKLITAIVTMAMNWRAYRRYLEVASVS